MLMRRRKKENLFFKPVAPCAVECFRGGSFVTDRFFFFQIFSAKRRGQSLFATIYNLCKYDDGLYPDG